MMAEWRQSEDALELWGGIECTVNRVGDRYFDQVVRSGHHDRFSDLELIAGLGVRALRYPVLWERIVPNHPDDPDWTWTDERLPALRDLGIRPIVTLCHHGSGPRWTGLLDPAFPAHLARFARMVAERYPWLDAYTPVNEPLTTARFAALYGHWHPHATDERSLIRALVHEVRATQLAMREIRLVNPDAELIQTEDLARVWSTPALRYQADYENERRWLSLDMLSGRVGRGHPLWAHLWWLGLTHAELGPMIEDACPPDVIGGNYYVTSERFLDHRLDRYPAWTHGGNGKDAYADVEAVRVVDDDLAGPAGVLREAWERYGRPVAVTEAHLGSTPEEQVRWLTTLWQSALSLRRSGVDARAVTVWALFGSYDWPSLCTREDDHYEPGAFDVRSSPPRQTPLARMAKSLADGSGAAVAGATKPGWWERRERLLYPPVDRDGRDIRSRAA
jgi:dTDP-4-dehydrorhamnose reductase